MKKIIASIIAALIIRHNTSSDLVMQIREWEIYIDAIKKLSTYRNNKRCDCNYHRYYTYYKTPIGSFGN